MVEPIACIEDQAFLLWRTGMTADEIAARLGVSALFVQSVIEDAAGAAPTAPCVPHRTPSEQTPAPQLRRRQAPAFLSVVRSRAPLP